MITSSHHDAITGQTLFEVVVHGDSVDVGALVGRGGAAALDLRETLAAQGASVLGALPLLTLMQALVGRGRSPGLPWLLAQLVHYLGLAVEAAVQEGDRPWSPQDLQTAGPRRKADREGSTLCP